MKWNDFYEVDGCTDFIPVKLIEEYKHMVNPLKVEVAETGLTIFVPSIYRFPKVNEQQKPVVPKFVAEWIKEHKDKGYRLSHALEKVFDDVKSSLYIKQQLGDYTEVIAKAWLAYPNITVEQEKLYTVEIPNPALDNLECVIVLKRIRGRVCLVNTYDYMGRELSDEYRLTESEIKQDFEWAWLWAKEVE